MMALPRPAANEPPTSFPSYPDLPGRIALITGIGQVGIPNSPTWGNGAATARVLSSNGVKIFGCDINLPAAETTKARLLALKPDAEVEVVRCDVTKQSDVDEFVRLAVARFGRVDILVNNVGATRPGDPATMSEDDWMGQIDVNLHSVYRCCHAVLPIMEAQGTGGSVVNNASITALRYIGKPQIAYATAKAAVIRYTKSAGVM